MKNSLYLFLLTLVLVSCGVDGNHFKIEGRFLHLNQGEFYVYSFDDGINGIDTIKVDGGRFAYETECKSPSTFLLVFPNFSEQPIFAEPGKTVEVKADASHLKALEVTGTKDNELMNAFRKQIENASPPEMVKLASLFIKDNLDSPVSVYLVKKYFISKTAPDYKTALALLEQMKTKQINNGYLSSLYEKAKMLDKAFSSNTLPSFSAYSINGESVSDKNVRNAPVGVISVWATWNYESMDIQRQLNRLEKMSKGKLKVVSICVDGSRLDCRNALHNDSVAWPTICDEQMIECPVLKTLGLFSVPDNIILKNGRIVARGVRSNKLDEKLKPLI